MNRILRCILFIAAAAVLIATPLQAATLWDGTIGDMNDRFNWDGDILPGGVDATINNGGTAVLSDPYAGIGNIGTLILDNGTLQLESGADLTINADVYAGNNAGTYGAIYQSGGSMTVNGGDWFTGMIGAGAYGYYNLSGGTRFDNGAFSVGEAGPGVIDQSGGTFSSRLGFNLSGIWNGGGLGVYNLTGGTFDAGNDWSVNVGRGGDGILSVSGTGVMKSWNLGTAVNGGNAGIINLGAPGTGGGLIQTQILKNAPGGTGLFNFHGGTLQVIQPHTEYGIELMAGDMQTYIYGEGATIDTNNHDATISGLLLGADGNGVTGATTIVGGSGYIGAPAVRVIGTGTGATAKATINPATGEVTGIVITNPGIGYDASSTTFELLGGGGTGASATDATVAANASGGLTKTGLGTLALNGSCTYTGTTTVEGGKLALNGIDFASTAIVVKSAGTLAGTTGFAAYPPTTVESGGTIAPGTPDTLFSLQEVNLADNANLNFTVTSGFLVDAISVVGNVTAVGGSPITVSVNFSGVPTSAVTLLSAAALDSNITFTLASPALDSFDAINTSSDFLTQSAVELVLNPAGAIPDSAWNNATGTGVKNWSTATNWGPPNTVPTAGDQRAMFTQNLSGPVSVPITLDISPQLSSIIFASPSGESYAITPSDSSKAITLKSALATNWHVSVLSGEHEVGANIIMAAGTGQSVIRLANDSHLTLSKVLSDETTMASSGLNFRGDFVLGTAPGRLTLSGANTYTGPTVVTNGILEVATLTDGGSASSIGDSPAAAANLVLNNATLKYTGPAVAIDRGFTVVGSAATLETANDLTFGGSVVSSGSIALTKNGTGALTLGDVNTGTSDLTLTNNGASVVTLSNVTTNVLDFRGIGGALSMTNASLKDFNVTGLVNVQTGDTITLSGGSYSRLNVGLVADAAIQQTGGTFEVLSTDWYNGMIGNNNYGYYGLSGGTLHLNGFLSIGELGLGVFEQSGGIFNADSGFSIGALWAIRGGGVYNLTGGTMNQSDGYDGIIYIGMGGNGELNVSGTGVFNAKYIQTAVYASETVDIKGIINLGAVGAGGGTIATAALENVAGETGVVNFHGGTLKATADATGDHFLHGTSNYIYGEGAVIDTDTFNVTIDDSLQAPTGKGVASIPLTDGGAGYIGTPLVNISGDGVGATAVAKVVDGVVTEIIITNPGVGYTTAPTATLVGGGATRPAEVDGLAVLLNVGNSSGGLTKLGAGTLTLSGTLSYTGDTVVSEGTLNVTTALNTPDAAVSVATGATLNAVSIVADTLNIGGTFAASSVATAPVPEPRTLVLLALAGLALAGAYLRRK